MMSEQGLLERFIDEGGCRAATIEHREIDDIGAEPMPAER